MNILVLEPYYTGSHKNWADGIQKHSRHQITLLTLKGQFWKWRMHGGAVTLARKFMDMRVIPDLILATDMLDLSTFLALVRERIAGVPTAVYFHENQLAYPWSPRDRDIQQKRDKHYGFINFTTALSADVALFNSAYNRDSFLDALPKFLNHFPDHRETGQIEKISEKSAVVPLGLDLKAFDAYQQSQNNHSPVILWNHRWEHDKNPESFFNALYEMKNRGLDFQLVLLGENFRKEPDEFIQSRKRLKPHLLHAGFVRDFAEYAAWLWKSDIMPVTSIHDFFGASVCEAAYCGCIPLLPRRLAYPDIFAAHPDLFYENESELCCKLAALLTHRQEYSAADSVAAFDWENMSEYYDTVFDSLAAKRPAHSIRSLLQPLARTRPQQS
ncbi:MAG: DUF3524 domain-containing protein [candidate division KSB1 bacterium]|nr:DUF3524 domain-containing protein [candidate division KSB1 bacterium]